MNIVYLVEDEREQPFVEAGEWVGGVAVRGSNGAVGIGFFLFDNEGKPLTGCCMSPQQAYAQGMYLVQNAIQMVGAVKAAQMIAALELFGTQTGASNEPSTSDR